jgi:hypothetical protein
VLKAPAAFDTTNALLRTRAVEKDRFRPFPRGGLAHACPFQLARAPAKDLLPTSHRRQSIDGNASVKNAPVTGAGKDDVLWHPTAD